jgi:hypothetical protein
MTEPMNREDARQLWARLRDSVAEIAEIRAVLGDVEIPDEMRQILTSIREQLADAGLPQDIVDQIHGLEPLGTFTVDYED